MAQWWWDEEPGADVAVAPREDDLAEAAIDPAFLYACERNLDPPVRCPSCSGRLDWNLSELRALDEGVGAWCPQCAFDFDADRLRRPMRYAMME